MTCAVIDAVAEETAAHGEPHPFRIVVYARGGNRRLRFVSDGAEVGKANVVEIVSFGSQAEADDVAQQCADYLMLTTLMAADAEGWHWLPDKVVQDHKTAEPVPVQQIVKVLLKASTSAVWARNAPSVGLQPSDASLPPTAAVAVLPSKRERSARVWTRDRHAALIDLIHQGYSAKEIAADPRFRGISDDAIYQEASRRGWSFRASPQITITGLPSSVLGILDRTAASCHKTRDGVVRALVIKAVADPVRYGLMGAI